MSFFFKYLLCPYHGTIYRNYKLLGRRKSKQANKVFGYNYSMPLDYRVAKLEQKATPA